MAKKYVAKQIYIEAMQWDGSRHSISDICLWANKVDTEDGESWVSYTYTTDSDVNDILVNGLGGYEQVFVDYWVVKNLEDGSFTVCDPDIFDEAFEEA